MKKLLFLILLICPTLLAEELPTLWLEAGKENEFQTNIMLLGPARDWSLRYEHRTLDSGKIVAAPLSQTKQQSVGFCVLKIKTPPLDPGVQLIATLFVGDKPYRKAVVASSEPFVDKKSWFEQHPIALYDPEKQTSELFKDDEIPFTPLRSFADIENVENAVIVIGFQTDFEREKGLSKILFKKATDGGTVLISQPVGKVPVFFDPSIHSMKLNVDAKYLFPLAAKREGGCYWTLKAEQDAIYLDHGMFEGKNIHKTGPTVLDIQFSAPPSKGRLMIDGGLRLCTNPDIETRYYFKSLIETLTEKGTSK